MAMAVAMPSHMVARLQKCLRPGAHRVACALTLVLLMCIVSHNLMAPFTYVLAQEFEGFLEDINDGEEFDAPYVPPVTRAHESGSSLGSDLGPNIVIKPQKKEEGRVSVDPHEFWDEDEFEGLPVEVEREVVSSPVNVEDKDAATDSKTGKQAPQPRRLQSYVFEAAGVLFFVVYWAVFWQGRKANEKIALAWASQFAGRDSVFEKNFSLVGFGDSPDDPSLIKEGQSTFKFYASGRRYCESLLATMVFQNRHDLLSRIIYLVSPVKDEITIEVNMNEEAMEPLCFALTRKKKAKDTLRDLKDLQQFATILNPPSGRKWVSEDLAVISESRELGTDLLTEGLLDQVFGEKAFETYSPYFVSLHFSDQFPEVKHKKVLQFKFVIPPANKMAEMVRLIALVPYFIDLMGRYKMSSTAKAKASGLRAKITAEESKEALKLRQEALQRKKAEQQTTMSSKREEKERLRQLKKSMPKVKMSRGH